MGSIAAIIFVFAISSWLLGKLIGTDSGPSRIARAVLDGDLDTLSSMLLKCTEAEKHEALFFAILIEGDKAFDLILDSSPDLKRPLQFGGAALHMAARYGTLHMIDRLLSLEVDIDQDSKGTPLYWAADAGRDDVVKRLLEFGADADAVDLELLGRSGFKPNFNTREDYDRISKLIRNSGMPGNHAVNRSDEDLRF